MLFETKCFSVNLMNLKCINYVNLLFFECQRYYKSVKVPPNGHQYLRLRLEIKVRTITLSFASVSK